MKKILSLSMVLFTTISFSIVGFAGKDAGMKPSHSPNTESENPPSDVDNPPSDVDNPPTGAENPPTGAENPPTGAENPPPASDPKKGNASSSTKVKSRGLSSGTSVGLAVGAIGTLAVAGYGYKNRDKIKDKLGNVKDKFTKKKPGDEAENASASANHRAPEYRAPEHRAPEHREPERASE